MFKRIGATILTIVMLLSMTSVYSLAAESEKMRLEVSLEDSEGNPRYYAVRGEVIQAVVKIKAPIAVRGLAVSGIFEDTPFELAGDPTKVTNKTEKFDLFDDTSASNSVLAAWIDSDVVQLQGGDVLMTVPLKVKQDAELSNATISFQITDVYIQGAGGKERLPDGDGYETESADADVLIFETAPEDTSLVVTSDKEVAEVGDQITVTVKVKDYHNNWSWMTIEGLYDENVLKIVGDPVPGEFKSGIDKAPVCNTETPGAIGVTWMNEQIVTKDPEFVALTLTFEVIDLPQDENEPLLSFFFDDKGIYGEGKQLITTGFKTSTFTPVLEITDNTSNTHLIVNANKGSVNIGEEVIVEVDVGNYLNNFATMTILGTYDDEKFDLIKTEYQTLSQGPAQKPAIIDKKDGTLAVTWFDTENLVIDANDPTVLKLTFRAMTGAENDTADFEFQFDPEGNLGTDGKKVTGVNNKAKTATVTLLPNQTTANLIVKADDVVYVGHQAHVYVYVNNYTNIWSGMTIQGTYDKDLVSVNKILPKNFGGDANDWIVNTAPDGQISVSWNNADGAVEREANFEALEIIFDVVKKGADSKADFTFSLAEVKDDNGESAPASWYDSNPAPASTSLKNTKLKVKASIDRAKVGSQVTYKLSLEGYQDNWMTMTFEVDYDPNVLAFHDATPSVSGIKLVTDTSIEGTVQAVLIHPKAMKLGLNPDVLELTFDVIGEDKGSTDVSFRFKEDGVIAVYPDNTIDIALEESLENVDVETTLDLFVASSLEIQGEKTVAKGDEYTVKLNLKDYKSNWSSFGVELEYDATAFEIEDPAKIVAPSFDGVDPSVDYTTTPGTIRLNWNSNAGNINADEESTVLTVTFKAKERKENAVFNAKLSVDNVDPYEYEANAAPLEVQIKQPYLSLEVVPSMNEGETEELKIYLHEYTNKWNSIPVVLTFDPDLIRINEDKIVCNKLGNVNGVKVLRDDVGMVVLTWVDIKNITAEGDKIELATIPFKGHRDGDAKFGAYFEANSLYTCNPQGGYDEVQADTYTADAKSQTVTIVNQYENMDVPMSLTVETVTETIKGKKETLALRLNNFNPRVRALSVKLFYDKDKVTITREDIQEMLVDGREIAGVYILNEDEGFVHFTWVSSGEIMANESNPTIATLCYTPEELGSVSFHAEFVQVIDNNKKAMDAEWDYVVRGESVTVNVNEIPSLSTAINKTDVVNIGDEVIVTVSVKDYLDRWSGMTINGSYDESLLRLESITPTNDFGNKNYKTGEGSFKASWSNAANVNADSDFDAITLVFKVIDCGSEGKAKIDLSFEEVLTNGTTPLIPDVDYLVNATGVDEINIKICKHDWSAFTHKDGTSGAASKHILTCAKNCGVIKEETCSTTTTTTKASCGKAGTITYNCALCGYNETLTDPNAPALSHKFDGTPVHKAGTKQHVYTCTRGCGATKEENCGYKTQVVEPTCVEDGYTLYICTICGGHQTGNVVKVEGKHSALTLHYIAPTASTNGSIITQCDTCKEYVVPPYAGAVRKTLKAGHPFPDVQDPTSWYYKEVIFNKAFDIFGGDEYGNFNPTSNITRGQLVTVLGRIIKAEAEKTMSAEEFNKYLNDQTSKVSGMNSASGFSDLGGKYYERYAKLFAKWGIVNGYPDGTFGGDKNITREEMATLIKRFVEAYPGAAEDIKFGNAATFSDFAKVSGWAKGNVEWVGKVGLFQGDTNKNYNPQSNATRAEIAVVIYRMLPVLKNICVCSLNH